MKILQLMSKELGLDKEFILKISRNNNAYKKYKIPKKNGEHRDIYHPNKNLKLLQYWLVKRIFSKFSISEYSTAYLKGSSIKKNALLHKDSNYILHIDICHFFESITDYHIDKLLNNVNGLDDDDKELIKNIVLFRGKHLVIGSVASPIISNCIMYDIDLEIINECIRDKGFIYTRYADDIVVSSKKYIEDDIIEKISAILEKNKFVMNDEKTYFMNKKGRRVITGVILDNNNNNLSIGNKRYKEIQRVIYRFLVKNDGDKDKILGYLSYIKDIDYHKYNSIRNTYCKYDKDNKLFVQ
ncbi:MAG: retron St85 family RNA-directed DNA polymerase [Dehalobacterium sp.]